MRFWKQAPLITKIYLVVIGFLTLALVALILLRASLAPASESALRGWLMKRTAATDRIPQTPNAVANFPATPAFAPGTPWLRAGTNAPIRLAPDNQATPAAILEAGQYSQIVGASPDRLWWAIPVEYFEGGVGWVSAADVIAENGENAPIMQTGSAIAATSVPADRLPVVQAIANVNVRSRPDLRAERIGILQNGQTAEVVGRSEDNFWWAIRLPEANNSIGWISRDYVVARNSDDVPVITQEAQIVSGGVPSPQPGKPYLTAVWNVNIRAGPGTEYAVVGTLDQGASAEIVGVSADGLWWAILYNGTQNERGWVAAAYVQASNTANVPVLK
jgi:uncharacterized protein YraI